MLSEDELAIVNGVKLFDVVGNTDGHPPWTEVEDDGLDKALVSGLGRVSQGADGGVGAYPPLYYALGAVGYKLSPWQSLLDYLEAMRLASSPARGGPTAVSSACSSASWSRGRCGRGGPRVSWRRSSRCSGSCRVVFNPDMGIRCPAARCLLHRKDRRAWRAGLTLRPSAC